MALLGKPNAYVGLDIGTSSLKVVELVQRHRRVEVATYAEANVPNPLLEPDGQAEDAVRSVANVVTQMMERAGVASDATIAALPSSIVFSTMLYLPDLPEKKMDEAVRFAARDVVPADLNEMFLGWSRVGGPPHVVPLTGGPTPAADEKEKPKDIPTVPVFMTAAPREIVERYQRVMDLAGLELVALEVETFPLVRSLLTNEQDSAMIVDIGDRATAYHIVDRGTARISHSIDYGGSNITEAIAAVQKSDWQAAHHAKVTHGILSTGAVEVREAVTASCQKIVGEAQRLLTLYNQQPQSGSITKTVLIGGGAKLPGLVDWWGKTVKHKVHIGNPWRGLSYPDVLQPRMAELGPTYGVAVGLAQRGLLAV